jgi:putative YhdH/YhfP family quinone oxidoreductase
MAESSGAESFRAVVVEDIDGKSHASIKSLTLADLPALEVLVQVEYSTLNYKDGLAVSGMQKIVRKPPLIAGIDLAGTVVESRDASFRPGDRVLVNGWGLSEVHSGGYTRYQRLKAQWLTKVPERFTTKQAMAIGTAGYTAALCVEAIEKWGVREGGPVLVTGAAGGVGSIAIALLAARGYRVTAATGRPATHDYLASLGASDFVSRAELAAASGPLQKERWGAAIDTVGGGMLVNVLAQTCYGGAVAACGLAEASSMPRASVLPHILRSVALLGVDSVMAPQSARQIAWERLTRDLDANKLAAMTTEEPLSKIPELALRILQGEVRGRVVIDVTN